MTVTFLGTGTSQGVPVIGCHCEVCKSIDFRDKRLRTSIHIEVDGKSFIIDSGPDFRQQVMREGIERLDALLFTHEHKDHTAGMDDIRAYNFRQRKEMPVYARQQVVNQLQKEFEYVFAKEKYPGAPIIKVHTFENRPFSAEGVTFTPINVRHYKMPVVGFRVKGFTYITDANYIAEEEKEKIRGSEILVLNALQQNPHISHFTLDEAIALADEVGTKKAYFTHISHRMGLHREVSQTLPAHIQLAYDGLKLVL